MAIRQAGRASWGLPPHAAGAPPASLTRSAEGLQAGHPASWPLCHLATRCHDMLCSAHMQAVHLHFYAEDSRHLILFRLFLAAAAAAACVPVLPLLALLHDVGAAACRRGSTDVLQAVQVCLAGEGKVLVQAGERLGQGAQRRQRRPCARAASLDCRAVPHAQRLRPAVARDGGAGRWGDGSAGATARSHSRQGVYARGKCAYRQTRW